MIVLEWTSSRGFVTRIWTIMVRILIFPKLLAYGPVFIDFCLMYAYYEWPKWRAWKDDKSKLYRKLTVTSGIMNLKITYRDVNIFEMNKVECAQIYPSEENTATNRTNSRRRKEVYPTRHLYNTFIKMVTLNCLETSPECLKSSFTITKH